VATGDMELAWQAANTVGHLAASPNSSILVQQGAVEELAYFLQVRVICVHVRVHVCVRVRAWVCARVCMCVLCA